MFYLCHSDINILFSTTNVFTITHNMKAIFMSDNCQILLYYFCIIIIVKNGTCSLKTEKTTLEASLFSYVSFMCHSVK